MELAIVGAHLGREFVILAGDGAMEGDPEIIALVQRGIDAGARVRVGMVGEPGEGEQTSIDLSRPITVLRYLEHRPEIEIEQTIPDLAPLQEARERALAEVPEGHVS